MLLNRKYIFIYKIKTIIFIVFLILASPISFADSKLNIFGLLIEEPCTVETQDVLVDFGTVTNKDIFYGNSEVRDFEIKLASCKDATFKTLGVKFDGISTENNQLLELNTNTVGSRVGIRIINELNQIMTFGESTTIRSISNGANILYFKAILTKKESIQDLSDISIGPFTAIATFTIKYQ